ncbi:MAG: ATP-binding protein, partial [Roseibium sp.]|uniref:ATP-binding protein n=1 Tax=Roseibium sp. TaxID=1936156 RepID=UPI00261C67C1
MALVTSEFHKDFNAIWREVKGACSGSDSSFALSLIKASSNQTRVFESIQKPNGIVAASDEETINLIRTLHVIPIDLQSAHSETETQAIAQCRRLLGSGDADQAKELWKELINIAKDVRLRKGTITIQSLWSLLRTRFELRHSPDFERDWETLSDVTADRKERIETELPSGYTVPRTNDKALLKKTLWENSLSVVFGESGCGKSALVKTVLDMEYPSWQQVWFGPEEFKTALSAAKRGGLPLRHELSIVLNATVKQRNVLVIDSAERIEPAEYVVIRRLLQAILQSNGQNDDDTWRVILITQPQSWFAGEEAMFGRQKAQLVELKQLDDYDVKLALLSSPSLGWLTGHDETISALRNLRTFAWVIAAGAAMGSQSNVPTSHTAIADRLWKYWTKDRADLQALMMRLAEREASFERSFALTDLDPGDTAIFAKRHSELPLTQNERTNRIEFEHDLAADWARFQFLKQNSTDTSNWAPLAENPLWTNALRMLGQFLLRQPAERGTAWDAAFAAAEVAKKRLVGDILLEALCLDPEAEFFLSERVEFLLANDAKLLTRMLVRFHHIGTVPKSGGRGLSSSLSLYMEAEFRSIIFARWPPLLRFLISQRERLGGLVSSALAKVIQTWLTGTVRELSNGKTMPFRQELAELALAMARTVQVSKGHTVMFITDELELYLAPLAGASDLPEEICDWALELAGRRPVTSEVNRRIAESKREKAEAHAERLKTDPGYKAQHERKQRLPPAIGMLREDLPPWPLGASRQVDQDFRSACITGQGIQSLMQARPEVAAEVLLALVIEDEPTREHHSSRMRLDLGLEFSRDGYPTAFWKSPFFSFLKIAPDTAVGALIELVNFCTERWLDERRRKDASSCIGLLLSDDSEKSFSGGHEVFCWPQSNDMGTGNLYCALDALERWLVLQIDTQEDVSLVLERLLREGNSVALISVLVNLSKYCPSLLKGPLAPLLTSPNLYFWDSARVRQIDWTFHASSWMRDG